MREYPDKFELVVPSISIMAQPSVAVVDRLARRKGYQILRSNFTCRYGELDLVVADGDTLVIMEVKTRLQNALYTPAEAVTRQKQERIKLATNVFLAASSSTTCRCALTWWK